MIKKSLVIILGMLSMIVTSLTVPSVASASESQPATQTSYCAAATSDAVDALTENQSETAMKAAKKHHENVPSNVQWNWEDAQVIGYALDSDTPEAVVTVANQEAPAGQGNQHFHLLRLVVQLDSEQVSAVQHFDIAPIDPQSGLGYAEVYLNGHLTGTATFDELGNYHVTEVEPNSDSVTTMGACEYGVGALCGTGGGAGCYLACAALGLVSGPGGLGCAAVCALIATLGCTAATDAICG